MNIKEFKIKHEYLIDNGFVKFDVIEANHLTGEYYLHLITIDTFLNNSFKIDGDYFDSAKSDVRKMGYKLSIYGTTTYIKRVVKEMFTTEEFLI